MGRGKFVAVMAPENVADVPLAVNDAAAENVLAPVNVCEFASVASPAAPGLVHPVAYAVALVF